MSEQTITLAINVNETSNTIDLSGFPESIGVVSIDISGDVDFTKLVESLEQLIDQDVVVNFTLPDLTSCNDKTSLVVNTVKEILEAYNQSEIRDSTLTDNNHERSNIAENSEVDSDEVSVDDIPF